MITQMIGDRVRASSRPAIVAGRIQCLDWRGLGHMSNLELGVESQLYHLDHHKGGIVLKSSGSAVPGGWNGCSTTVAVEERLVSMHGN